jgi:hypothetical protein
MTSQFEPERLASHHRNTMRKMFQHPTGNNIEWHDVVSMLRAVGTVEQHHDNSVKVTIADQSQVFGIPRDKDIEMETVLDLRHMLAAAGYGLEQYGDRKD